MNSSKSKELRSVSGTRYGTIFNKTVLLFSCALPRKIPRTTSKTFHKSEIFCVSLFYIIKLTISLEVLQARWRLFGHVLRREPSIPANKAMAFYFHDNAKRARGRPITTLPMTLNNDLKILQNRSISLTSQKDLETIRKIAERRQEWTTFTADIKRAAEAARSDDTPSGRP